MDVTPFLGKLVEITIKKEYRHLQNAEFLEDITLIKKFIITQRKIDNHIIIESNKIKGNSKYWIIDVKFIEEIKEVAIIII